MTSIVRLFAMSLLMIGCYTGPAADHFLAVIEELDMPAQWQVVETVVRGPGQGDACNPGITSECPAAIRFFVLDDGRAGAYADARDAVSAAGFRITDEYVNGCPASSRGGRQCGFFAARGADLLYVGVFDSPQDAGLDEGAKGVAAVMIRSSGTE